MNQPNYETKEIDMQTQRQGNPWGTVGTRKSFAGLCIGITLLAQFSLSGGEQAPEGTYRVSASTTTDCGVPLGGIGAGFVELQKNGCFSKWMIFNNGGWVCRKPASQSGKDPSTGPDRLRFYLCTADPSAPKQASALRYLGLRSEQSDLYSQPFLKAVEGIDMEAWYPMTRLNYRDSTLPVQVSASVFSPFIPRDSRASGTPGFHVVFEVKNTSSRTQEVALAGVLENPLAWGEADRKLTTTLRHGEDNAILTMRTDTDSENKTTKGSLSFSVHGGQPSWDTGMFEKYANSHYAWQGNDEFGRIMPLVFPWTGYLRSHLRLSNSRGGEDPAKFFRLTDKEIDQLSEPEMRQWLSRLSGEALIGRVASELQETDPAILQSAQGLRRFLKEVAQNLSAELAGADRTRSKWGTGALCSTVTLLPGETKEIRFTLGWFFPHHFSEYGREMGHMYENWFADAEAVNRFLNENYSEHRRKTEGFARVMADTTLGQDMAFAWSSQLGTLARNTWWVKDGAFAIWEGLGCCGLSTTDINYQGTFGLLALFPDIQLGQMERIAKFTRADGRVMHNYARDTDKDDGGFSRVDMNPQFVMMVARDYLWTGDKGYLQRLWPLVVRMMEATGRLDSDGDGLPDTDCGTQTYDCWHMSGSPSYIDSLWIGSLNAAIKMAEAMVDTEKAEQWKALLAKATASFEKQQWNGEYYSLWVDKDRRNEVCMTDQISGEWFTGIMGLKSTLSADHLRSVASAVFKYNFTPEQGLFNASNPPGRPKSIVRNNLAAVACWTGVEYAFASMLMDMGRYEQGKQIVASIHDRHVRAGREWNHHECGDYYHRALSSWATLLAATGFKYDRAQDALTILPTIPDPDFRAPWGTPGGYGSIIRQGTEMQLSCSDGQLPLRSLRIPSNSDAKPSVELSGRTLPCDVSRQESTATLQFEAPLTLEAGQTLKIGWHP